MKKTVVLIVLAVNSLFVKAQETNTWRIGVQSGLQMNRSKFSGGMPDANARFHKNPFGATGFGLIVRYDLNNRWMVQSGLNLNNNGFEFALSENYSFTQPGKRFTTVKSNVGMMEIPVLVSYKFKPNCSNSKWFVTGGIAHVFVGAQTINKSANEPTDGPGSLVYLSSTTTSNGGYYLNARFTVGKEKVFKCGSILQASLIFNHGFGQVAKATVNYTVDGQSYTHQFTTNGSFVGLRVAYFLRPLHNPWKNPNSRSQKTSAPKNSVN